ncbi:MAG: hypothetical protein KIT45_07635 [Fimbriimonadia bacterium]|nr:hypothetical protein [Fimbriimonadia bacterium]
MRCENCDRVAVITVKAVVKLALCRACADRWGRAQANLPLGQWMRSLVGAPLPQDQCPLCGSTQRSIQETGCYGCALCYELFPLERV